MRKVAVFTIATCFAAQVATGALFWEPALGRNGIPFDPTVVPGVDPSVNCVIHQHQLEEAGILFYFPVCAP